MLKKRNSYLSARPIGESGFADGRSRTSPDSEQMEQTATALLLRNSGSVEQIQDRSQFFVSDSEH